MKTRSTLRIAFPLIAWITISFAAYRTAQWCVTPNGEPDHTAASLDRSVNSVAFTRSTSDAARPELKAVWQRLKAQLLTVAPRELHVLNEPASEDALKRLEARLQVRIPDDLRCWLSLHNGTHDPSGSTDNQRSFCGFSMYSVAEMIARHETRAGELAEKAERYVEHGELELDTLLRADWSPRYLDIGRQEHNDLTIHLAIDLETGEIVRVEYDYPENSRNWRRSFARYLDVVTERLSEVSYEMKDQRIQSINYRWTEDEF